MCDKVAPKSVQAREQGPLAWMAHNSVAANLLMFVLIVGGLFGVFRAKQEVFPEFTLDEVSVVVGYPGASPAEVEQGVLLAIEERVRGLDGVKRIRSEAREGVGKVNAEFDLSANPDQVLADVKREIDRIATFPKDVDKPTVSMARQRNAVISMIISGDQELSALHELGEAARRELLATDEITQVELQGVPPLEIAVEVPRETLAAYGLSLQKIATEISAASLELPGGGIETTQTEILVRVADRRQRGHELEALVLRSNLGGGEVRLGDIAHINDGYADTEQYSRFNGDPAVRLTAYRVGEQTPSTVASAVRSQAERLRERLPAGVRVEIWNDESESLEERIDLLMRNAVVGLVLVLAVLALLLDLRLAFWVALGIPISFLGSFVVLGGADLSINMITMFAFIVTLGMVVDDAIVVGERAHAMIREGLSPEHAAVSAAREMLAPVTFAILTTVAAFAPMLFVPGALGKTFAMIPTVIISVLAISLIESFFILPAHLARATGLQRPRRGLLSRSLERFTHAVYRPLAAACIRRRYSTFAVALAVLVLTVGYVASGRLPFDFFPSVDGNVITVKARLPHGVALDKTEEVAELLAETLDETVNEFGGVRGVFSRVGESAGDDGPGARGATVGSHLLTIEVALVPPDQREFDVEEFSVAWQARTPILPGVSSITFESSEGPSAGEDIAVELRYPGIEVLAEASTQLQRQLQNYPQLRNIVNPYTSGKPQIDLHLLDEARRLGLSSKDIAQQLRASFYGAEAVREQRGRHELRVMVRLPKSQRRSEHDLDTFKVRTAQGGEVPLHYVARLDRGQAPTAISRYDGQRTVTVSAEFAAWVKSPDEALETLEQAVFQPLLAQFPGLEIAMVGAQREQGESFAALSQGYAFALFVIFALLAVAFRSYVQPIIVMAVIPFGFVGAVWGHVVMGYGLSITSVIGLIAVSGVVVNDSLILIDATNRERRRGRGALDAAIEGGAMRLRAILLTSLTTFCGLMPMLTETSVQARFLIPMAISLGFGIVAATIVVLVIVPALYMIVEDLREIAG